MRRVGHSWRAIGTTNQVIVTEAHTIVPASRIARNEVDLLDATASRFRPDSELSRLNAGARHHRLVATVSPLLADLLTAALVAADFTDGIVTPTVGRAVQMSGYDADITRVQSRSTRSEDTPSVPVPAPAHHVVGFDPTTRTVGLAPGTSLDLGATAKAVAADRIATRLARSLPGGFLVNLGGDIAVAGEEPVAGWPVAVDDHHGRTLQVVAGHRNAFATSSTQRRSWVHDGTRRHHIVDPRSGRSCEVVWAQVTCAAMSALVANAASTAAIVLGEAAPDWLAERGIAARLDRPDGRFTTTSGWPTEQVIAA